MKNLLKICLLISMLISITWAKELNLNTISNQAKKQNKQLMFFFHIPGCPYCKSMLKENFKDKETLKEIDRNFVFVDIYTKDDAVVTFKDFKGTPKEFTKYMRVFTYPTTQFRSASSQLIHEARGYRNTDELLTEIKYIASRSYKKMDLETFAEELEFAKDD